MQQINVNNGSYDQKFTCSNATPDAHGQISFSCTPVIAPEQHQVQRQTQPRHTAPIKRNTQPPIHQTHAAQRPTHQPHAAQRQTQPRHTAQRPIHQSRSSKYKNMGGRARMQTAMEDFRQGHIEADQEQKELQYDGRPIPLAKHETFTPSQAVDPIYMYTSVEKDLALKPRARTVEEAQYAIQRRNHTQQQRR
jgi:hypothetical protein